MGHFGDESFQAITCTGTDNKKQPGENTPRTQNVSTLPCLLHASGGCGRLVGSSMITLYLYCLGSIQLEELKKPVSIR